MKAKDIRRSIRNLQLKASADLDCRVHRDIDQTLAFCIVVGRASDDRIISS